MIKFCSLSSGSKGNTAFIEINGDKYLIDIGNTSLYVEKTLQELGVEPKDIKGIFISKIETENISEITIKTTISKVEISPTSLLPIIFKTKNTKK